MKLRWVLVALVLWGAWQHWQHRPVDTYRTPGITVVAEPVQTPLETPRQFQKAGYQVQTLAGFDIEARVLSVEHYALGRESDLSPVDLALGWGPMSDAGVLKDISISQGGRFYHWQVEAFPIPREAIETHSANMHMIPANEEIEERLAHIREGQIVHLRGYLVEATAEDGWHWRSSMTREDTGSGACELVWVEAVDAR